LNVYNGKYKETKLTSQCVEWTGGTDDAVGAFTAHLETDEVALWVAEQHREHDRPVGGSLYQVDGRCR